MRKVVFSRKNDKINVGGKNIVVPSDRSFASIIGNAISDKTHFADDGYIYQKEKKIRKWFAYREEWNHYWEPVLEDLHRIERVYNQAKTRHDKIWKKQFEIVRQITNLGNIAHFFHKKNGWGSYKIDNSEFYGQTMGFDWLKGKPKKLINKTLGQQLMEIDFKVYKWHYLLKKLLDEAIIKFLNSKYTNPKDVGSQHELTINGRRYIYLFDFVGRSSRPTFRSLAFPGDKYYTLEV